MSEASFADLLRASRSPWEQREHEKYVNFLRSTPHPDEPHECRKRPVCVLCDLLEARDAYDEENVLPWEATDPLETTLISDGYHHTRDPLESFRSVQDY